MFSFLFCFVFLFCRVDCLEIKEHLDDNTFLKDLYLKVQPEKYIEQLKECCKQELEGIRNFNFFATLNLKQKSQSWLDARKLRITGKIIY